ncbi:hypothetical protein KFL_009500040 [Klebsormidium nitens]|uniref:MYND-type domain-containing protein n=1 Tax=Klebsormidium nitens TaxID=105231 RepID=A0A1Y1ITT2_KLENI|nr:hypothetical protein KFL_009500040 [Klebsormidium nitens]|eukprot:GAQ92226.1 hypothetical protein KFL_009500040 [Klebsormidium nitens]
MLCNEANEFGKVVESGVLDAMESLDELRVKLKEHPVRFSRVNQEIAIYKQGAVIKKLIEQLFQEQDKLEALHDALFESLAEHFRSTNSGEVLHSIFNPDVLDPHKQAASILVFSRMATSKVVAQVFLSKEEVVERMMQIFSKKLGRVGPFSGYSREIMYTLQGIASFAQASKLFRQSMEANGMNLLPAVQILCSEYILPAEEDEIYASREAVARVIESLSFSIDSRRWMIDAGYIHVLAELFRTKRPGEKETKDVILRSAFSLLRLLESQECLKKMKECDVLSLLRPVSKVLELDDLPGVWSHIENKLSDDAGSKQKIHYVFTTRFWKGLKRADFAIRTVCSWKDCAAVESHSDTAFSKCGRCGVAPYCSKEHQKLHWPSHKKHSLSKGEKPLG